MLLNAIQRIEQVNSIENIALKFHAPSNGVYVIVDKEFNFKIISKERFSFNSKYVAMDFYSQLINLNKSVDKKKLITSNNYLTFFCKNINKLNDEIIDSYYDKLETPEECSVYKDWIKENIFDIFKQINTKDELIKIFFLSDIENYIELGKRYFNDYILSNEVEIGNELFGNSTFINLNAKKPFLKTLTRKNSNSDLVNKEEAIKYMYLRNIFLSFAKKGYEMLYVLEDGKLLPINYKGGEMPDRNFKNGLIFVYEIDNRGNLIILDMDTVPDYNVLL